MENKNLAYIDVGGTIFKTSKNTIFQIPYFKRLVSFEGIDLSNKINPYFLDRDPEIFNHVLNLMRNSNYPFPKEYECELEFYGLKTQEYQEAKDIQLIQNSDFFADLNIMKHAWDVYLTGNPQITFTKSTYKRYTDIHNNLDRLMFDNSNWSYEFKGNFCIGDVYILIPSTIPLSDFKYFNLKFTTTIDTWSNWNLAAAPYLSDVQSINGFHYVKLLSLGDYLKFPLIPVEHHSLTLTLASEKYQGVKTGLKFYKIFPDYEEVVKFKQVGHEYLVKQINSYEIKDGELELPTGPLIFMMWKTDDPVDTIQIKNKNVPDSHYILDRADFQYLERKRLGKTKLPDNWGVVYFCVKDFDDYQPTGSLSNNKNYSIEFDKPVNGIAWIGKYNVARLYGGMMGFAYSY